jgi:hypothetical protein
MSSPDIELLSTKRISLRHLGHFVSDNFDAGVRRYLSVIQEGNFICDSYRLVAASRRALRRRLCLAPPDWIVTRARPVDLPRRRAVLVCLPDGGQREKCRDI